MSPSRIMLLMAFVILLSKGCTTTKATDYEKNITVFLDLFEKNLVASDEVILKQFKIQQSEKNITEEGIMKAIRIMQNRDQNIDSITCSLNFKGAIFTQENSIVRVEITSKFKSIDPTYSVINNSKFILWLTYIDEKPVITKIDAIHFYNSYRDAVRDLASQKNRQRILSSLQHHLEQAHNLQQTYDTVVWFTQYNDSIYYYVANGTFNNYFLDYSAEHPHSFTMGLVSETGRVVIPPAFDIIGTIGYSKLRVVEVKKNGRVGHFSLDGKELVPPVYDWIILSEEINDSTYALVKQDSLNGWLDKSFTFHKGFPDKETERYIREFGYLDSATLVSKDVTTITRILHPEHSGFGIVIPPSYLVSSGILNEVVSEINLGEQAGGTGREYYGTEYIKSKGSIFERISESLSALFVMIEGSYLGGREDFYRYKTLTFVDSKGNLIGSEQLYSGENKFKQIDSTLLELKTTVTASDAGEYWDMGDEPGDWNPPQYRYYKISLETNAVVVLESNRRFACTEFVKMDSSYLMGEFVYWDSTQNTTGIRNFASNETLIEMRNEILASYGYAFTDPKVINYFKYRKWYISRYQNYDDFMHEMTEIDRHNLEFLESMIGTLRAPQA